MGDTLRFTSRLTRKDHLWYFARHYFPDLWMPWLVGFGVSFVFAVAYFLTGMDWDVALLRFVLGGLVMVLLMFLLVILLYGLKLHRLSDTGAVLSEKQVEADAEGVRISYPSGSSAHAWSGIESIKERGRFVFLKLAGDEILLLFARRDLPPGAVQTLRDHLRRATDAA